MDRLRILTWHVHGSYLEYLGLVGHELLVPVLPGRPPRFGGRPPGAAWPGTIREVPAEDVRSLDLDAVLFQAAANWTEDQHAILGPAQRRLPRIYLEHDPPLAHPTETRHPVDDPDVLVVHVTHYNALMWDNGASRVRVIDHGVTVPDGLRAVGDLARGIAVGNHLARRGRRLGGDLFAALARDVPLDLVGMGSEELGGLGEVPHAELPALMARYRFYFHTPRYTSLGLAACEAMMLGLPVVALATTEMPSVVRDGESGFLANDPEQLAASMRLLVRDPDLAAAMGTAARRTALERFDIHRFARDWDAALAEVVGRPVDGGGARPMSEVPA